MIYYKMPIRNIDFSKTIIYKIVSKDLNIKDCYVGSTTNFIQRKSAHRTATKKDSVLKVYKTINLNGGWDNWEMIEIEKYPCADSNEATKRERYFYELLNATMNSNNPNKPRKEWLLENEDNIKLKRKELYHCWDCNVDMPICSRYAHKKTMKHKNNKL